MSDILYGIQPQDWIRQHRVLGNDESVMLRIKYTGSQAAAHITTAATTGDITFEQGATTAAAAVGTGTNPGTAGVIDLSDYATLHALKLAINSPGDDWFAWLEDCPPDLTPELSAGNCSYITSETDQDCTVLGGKALLYQTDLETNESHYLGITLNGDPTVPHSNDHQVLHEILQIYSLIDFGTTLDSTLVYEYDDDAGTKVQVGVETLVDNTATTINLNGEPIYATKGKRWGIVVTGTGAIAAAATLRVHARSHVFGRSANRQKLLSSM